MEFLPFFNFAPAPTVAPLPGDTISKDVFLPEVLAPIVKPSSKTAVAGASLSKDAAKVDPLTLAAFASMAGAGQNSGGKIPDFNSTAGPSRADSQSGEVRSNFQTGDFIVNGTKNSIFQTALVAGGAVVVGLLLLRIFQGSGKKK